MKWRSGAKRFEIKSWLDVDGNAFLYLLHILDMDTWDWAWSGLGLRIQTMCIRAPGFYRITSLLQHCASLGREGEFGEAGHR